MKRVVRAAWRRFRTSLRMLMMRREFLRAHGVRIEPGSLINPSAMIRIGKYSFIARGVVVGPNCKEIGAFCSIGQDAIIGPNVHRIDAISTSSSIYSFDSPRDFAEGRKSEEAHQKKSELNASATVVGNDVWIGARAIVLAGVHLGDGAVVGAGSIVTRDVAPYSVVVGNPARHLRYRFSPATIEKLISARMYDKDPDVLFSCFRRYGNAQLESYVSDLLRELEGSDKPGNQL